MIKVRFIFFIVFFWPSMSMSGGCLGSHSYNGTHVFNRTAECATTTPGTCSALDVAHGGTGVCLLTAYAVLCGGTTTINPVQSVASIGTSGYFLTSNGAGVLPTFQIAPSNNAIISTYNVGSGNHTLNVRTQALTVIGFGGGGGGGSGRAHRRGTTSYAGGGSGGGAGGVFCYTIPASFFGGGGSIVPYVVGAGGIGGAAVSGSAVNGNPGTSGGYTSFGNLQTSTVINNLGLGGIVGTAIGGLSNVVLGNLLSSSSATSGGNGNNSAAGSDGVTLNTGLSVGTGGGGGGGSRDSPGGFDVGFNGGAGGSIVSPGTVTTLLSGGIAGVILGGSGGSGNNGTLIANAFYGGTGGGGGAGNPDATAGSGGNGGMPGGGGGGGGGCGTSTAGVFSSGAGGNGGDGILYIIEYL